MDNQRFILFIALSLVLFLMWDAWQEDYKPRPATVAEVATATIPQIAPPSDMPQAKELPETPLNSMPAMTTAAPKVDVLSNGERIHVVTDQLDIIIDTFGGDIRQADLLHYPIASDQPDVPFQLMKDTLPNMFVAQSGLLSKASAADHYTLFKAEKKEYFLAADQDELHVPLTWQSDDGISIRKTFIFKRGAHTIDVVQQVQNNTSTDWSGRQYRQLQRSRPDGSNEQAFIYTYNGGVVFSEEEKYEKIDFDDMQERNLSREIAGGWAAMIQHYFLAAIVPPKDENNHFYSKAPGDDRFVLGLVSPSKSIAAGRSGTFNTRFYVGPKLQSTLEELAEGLDLTVDYGFLTVISKPLFWCLEWFNNLFGNWGWAIIMVTLIIKLIFFPLSSASYRSMANMRKFAPKMQQLKERYGDDRQKMSQAMMELYKKEKINPLGGCLPMMVQIPVFIALYWVLLESVELRQAPFILWITDLSIRDPYYILPLLMGLGMYVQQKLNPPPPDPVQAKVMMALPFIFTLFFAFFPAGLVLYWTANSMLSIAQQWYITKKVEKAAKK